MTDDKKCAECGFLTAEPVGGEYPEIIQKYRDTGTPKPGTGFNRTPVCFVSAHPLADEYRTADGRVPGTQDDRPLIYLSVIQKPRVCPMFEQYEETQTPQEHMDTIDAQRDERQRINRERADAKRQEAAIQKRHIDDLAESKRKHDVEMEAKRAELEIAREKTKNALKSANRALLGSLLIALIGAIVSVRVAETTAQAAVEAAMQKAFTSPKE